MGSITSQPYYDVANSFSSPEEADGGLFDELVCAEGCEVVRVLVLREIAYGSNSA